MDDNTLSVYIRRLRSKIEEEPSSSEASAHGTGAWLSVEGISLAAKEFNGGKFRERQGYTQVLAGSAA